LSLDDSGELYRAFNVMQVPSALIADGGGRILRRLELKDLDSEAALRAAASQAIEPVSE
jgi:hypothetical protein